MRKEVFYRLLMLPRRADIVQHSGISLSRAAPAPSPSSAPCYFCFRHFIVRKRGSMQTFCAVVADWGAVYPHHPISHFLPFTWILSPKPQRLRGLLTWFAASTSSFCVVERRDPLLSDLMLIAQGEHPQAFEVLPVKVLGKFMDIFSTVPHSKWSKHVDTQRTFCSIHSSMISITKTGLFELCGPSLGIQSLLYSCYIISVFHQCNIKPHTELPIPGTLTVLLFAAGAQGNSCSYPQPGSWHCPYQTRPWWQMMPQRLGKPRTCCLQPPWASGSLSGECQIHQPPHSWRVWILLDDSGSALSLGKM